MLARAQTSNTKKQSLYSPPKIDKLQELTPQPLKFHLQLTFINAPNQIFPT